MCAKPLRSPIFGVGYGVLFSVLLLPVVCHAGLSAPPPSYVTSVGDGTRLLVMLSPIPLAHDTGDMCELPTGEKVSLRKTFPASGLYENGSITPIWTVDWFEPKWRCKLSHDGRYLVRINQFGGLGFTRPEPKFAWGVKFYGRGEEVWSLDVRDLIDYPSLMRYTGSSGVPNWYDDVSLVESNRDDLFLDVRTSTRDDFRFDARTGELLQERRFWRHVAKASIIVPLFLAVGAVFLAVRWLKSPGKAIPAETPPAETRLTFSLRSLLLAVAFAALCCGMGRYSLLGVFLVWGLALCGYLSVLLYRAGRRAPWALLEGRERRSRAGWWFTTTFSWLACYLLSWPVSIETTRAWPWDFRMAFFQVFYAPLIWLEHWLRSGVW